MRINRRLSNRLSLLFTLVLVLSVASSRLNADTGTCGGASITLPFMDVPSSNIFFCSIAEAYFSGLTNGTDATHYSPSGNVTREQMAAFVTRTQDSALRRGSRHAALGQWAIPTSVPSTGRTVVGNEPGFVKSDGEDLWVANNSSGTLSRVHASDGKLLGTWTGVFNSQDLVIARGRIFVCGQSPASVYVVDPTQPPGPATTLTASLPSDPSDITFDGFNLWTTGTLAGSISRINPNSGSITTFSGFNFPFGIIYDGVSIWVTEGHNNGALEKVDKSTGAIQQTVSVGSNPNFPVYDGTNIWVPNQNSNSVTVVKASTGVVLGTLSGNNLGIPFQAAFDGERILVTNIDNDSVSLWRASDLTPLGFATGATSVRGACSDGFNFWLVLIDGPPGHLVRF